jgi:hypothetical protein
MTESNRSTEKPSPAAPRPAATTHAHDSGWMLAPGSESFSREELLARYRRQRALPEDPFEQGGKPAPPPGYRERLMSQQQNAARFVERGDEQQPPVPQKRSFSIGQTFAVASAMALAAGAGVGVVSAMLFSRGDAPVQVTSTLTPVQANAGTVLAPAPTAQVTQTTVITKKAVQIATLEVSDASGETNSFIPLALNAQPAELGSDILLKISGIPKGAYLTSGRKEDDENWALTLGELKNLKLVIPEAETPRIDLAVAAFEPKTGELAAPVKTMTVALSDVSVQPTSAPPPMQTSVAPASPVQPSAEVVRPQPIPPPDSTNLVAYAQPEAAAARSFVLQGDTLLKSGDVREARRSYEQAWAYGSPAGAFAMAQSYDPLVIGSLSLRNATPDKNQALVWYERAATAGHVGAADSIVRLRLKP